MQWVYRKRSAVLVGVVFAVALPLGSHASLQLVANPGGERAGQLSAEPTIIEAETVSARVSGPGREGGNAKGVELNRRALPEYDAGARNGFILRAANAGGPSNHVSYTLPGVKPGHYRLWARHRGKAIAAAISVDGRAIASTVPASAGSGFNWVEAGTLDVQNGDTLDVSIRGQSAIDAFALTAAGAPRMDEVLDASIRDRAFERRYPAAVLARARAYYPPVEPIWSGNPVALPEWFDLARVQVHTRLAGTETQLPVGQPAFLRMGADMAAMGVRAYTRHIKTGDEGAWWPTRYGAVHPLVQKTQRDFAKDILADSMRNKVPMIVYERHMEDAAFAMSHPDAVTRNPAGAPFFRRGKMISLLDPAYLDLFIGRSAELVNRGAKGFYLDEDHMPLYGDWSPATLAAFRKDTGLPPPVDYDIHDPVYLAFLRWYPRGMGEALARFTHAMRQKDPDSALLLSANRWPALTIGHYDGAELRTFTSVKTEFAISAKSDRTGIFAAPADFPDPAENFRPAFGWVLSRDAADGRPAHVWISRAPGPDWGKLFPTAAVIAHGCIANLDMTEAKIPDASFRPAIMLGNKASDALHGARPFRHVGFLLSDWARYKYIGDSRAIWMHASGLVRYGWDAAKRAQIPAGFVTEAQLLDASYMKREQFRVIVAPASADLPPEVVSALNRLRTEGVVVISNRPEWDWSSETGNATAQAALLNMIAEAAPSPARISAGPSVAASDFFVAPDGTKIATFANDASWMVRRMMKKKVRAKQPDNGDLPSAAAVRGPVNDATLEWRLDARPRSVIDVVSEQSLNFTYSKGLLRVQIPSFRYLSVVVVKP